MVSVPRLKSVLRKASDLLADWIPLVLAGAGLMVVAAWAGFLPLVVTQLHPALPNMKAITALCFLCAGLELHFLKRYLGKETVQNQFALTAPALAIFYLMIAAMLYAAAAPNKILEIVLFPWSEEAKQGRGLTHPSIATMLALMQLAVAGCLVPLVPDNLILRLLRWVGWWCLITGISGWAGYLLKIPALYCSFPGLSQGMALPTTIIFFLVGAHLLSLQIETPSLERLDGSHHGDREPGTSTSTSGRMSDLGDTPQISPLHLT